MDTVYITGDVFDKLNKDTCLSATAFATTVILPIPLLLLGAFGNSIILWRPKVGLCPFKRDIATSDAATSHPWLENVADLDRFMLRVDSRHERRMTADGGVATLAKRNRTASDVVTG